MQRNLIIEGKEGIQNTKAQRHKGTKAQSLIQGNEAKEIQHNAECIMLNANTKDKNSCPKTSGMYLSPLTIHDSRCIPKTCLIHPIAYCLIALY